MAHSIVKGLAYEPTPWRASRRRGENRLEAADVHDVVVHVWTTLRLVEHAVRVCAPGDGRGEARSRVR